MKRVLAASLFFVSLLGMAEDLTLDIGAEQAPGQLKVTPIVTSATDRRLRYEVIAQKDGPSGRSQSRQNGNLNVRAGMRASASTLALGVAPGDRYSVTVILLEGDRVVAEKTLDQSG